MPTRTVTRTCARNVRESGAGTLTMKGWAKETPSGTPTAVYSKNVALVTVINDLRIRGFSLVVKAGTKVRNIRSSGNKSPASLTNVSN